MLSKDTIFTLLDLFLSEYGWSFSDGVDFIYKTPMTILFKLYKKIIERKKNEYKINTQLTGYATAAAFAGKLKELDKLFNEDTPEISEDTFNSELETLWHNLGKDPSKLQKQLKNGKVKL